MRHVLKCERMQRLDLPVYPRKARNEDADRHEHLATLAIAQGAAQAQTTNAPPKKSSVAQTSCKDYLEMDEVVKPKFIYFTVGYSKRGKPTSETFDVVNVDRIKPVVDEYCRVHLTSSAYQKVMDQSIASEKTNK